MLTDDELELLRGRTSNPDTLKALAELDRKREWQAKVAPFVDDVRVWSIVAAIAESGMAHLESDGFIAEDVMGCKPQYYAPTAKERRRGRILGTHETCYRIGAIERYPSGLVRTHSNHELGVVLSREGWEKALPVVQRALDGLQVPYEAGEHSGLSCALGKHWWERVWHLKGVDLPECDSLLGDFPYVSRGELANLPMTWRLIRTEGWRTGRGGYPIRPDNHISGDGWTELGDRIRKAAPDVAKRWMQR